tara:strand:+ start:90 stop:197 length:108 start_codon:yes stop_codon:yes gene_type:complete
MRLAEMNAISMPEKKAEKAKVETNITASTTVNSKY